MFGELYVPNKLRNKAVEEICFDLHYVREYYQREPLKLYDCSNTTTIKIDLQNSIRLYLNDDSTADVCTWGPGLQRNIPFREVIHEWVLA